MPFAAARFSYDQHRRPRLAGQADLFSNAAQDWRSVVPCIETKALRQQATSRHQLFGEIHRARDIFHGHELDFPYDQEQPVGVLQGEEIDVPPTAAPGRGDRSLDDPDLTLPDL